MAAFVTATPLLFATRSGPARPAVAPRRPAPPSMVVKAPPVSPFKQALLDRVAPLNFGRAVADNRLEQNEIEALIRQVEATNKSADPAGDPNLPGVWTMLYSTSANITAPGLPAFLQSRRIEQTIDVAGLKARNEEAYNVGPFEITNAVDATLYPETASRFHVNFVQFEVAGLFKFNVEKNPRFSGWLDVTYLDEDLRISRGYKGNVFVLVKKN